MLIELLQAPLQLCRCEVLVRVVDRLALAPVYGHDGLGKQLQTLAQFHKLPTDFADSLAVILAKVGDGLEGGRQTLRHPHQLHITLTLTLKATTGGDSVEITVDVEL